MMPQPSAASKTTSTTTRLANQLLQMAGEKESFVPDKNLGQCSIETGFLLEKLFNAAGEPILNYLKNEPQWQTFHEAAKAIFDKDFSMYTTRKTFAAEIIQSTLDMLEGRRKSSFPETLRRILELLSPLLEDGTLSLTLQMQERFFLLFKEGTPKNISGKHAGLNPDRKEKFLKLVKENLDGPTTTVMAPSHLPGEIDPARLGTDTPFVTYRLQKGTSHHLEKMFG
jgi:hypothetical protein